jgi:hypothetical protein
MDLPFVYTAHGLQPDAPPRMGLLDLFFKRHQEVDTTNQSRGDVILFRFVQLLLGLLFVVVAGMTRLLRTQLQRLRQVGL